MSVSIREHLKDSVEDSLDVDADADAEDDVHSRSIRWTTNYDLPIEFYQAAILKREALSIRLSKISIKSALKVSIAPSSLSRSIGASSRFEFLHPRILHKRLEEKESYGFLRFIAVRKLNSEIFRVLRNLYKSHICFDGEEVNMAIPFRVFSWSKDDFLLRRKLKTMTWCSVLQKAIPEHCLERQKFKFDLEELFRFLSLIFRGCIGEEENFDIQVDVVNYIEETYDYLSYFQQLLWEIDENNTVFRIEINRSLFLTFNSRDSKQQAQKLILEEKLMNNDVWDPIEVRYQLRFYSSKGDQADYKMDEMVAKYEAEINDVLNVMKRETYCFQCAMNTYYMEIENFKSRIAKLSAKYEVEFEKVENELIYKKLSMDKLREQRKFYMEQVARFHEEIELLRLRELAEKEREARLIREKNERLEAAALMKNSKKEKKKKKSKG